MSVYAIQLKNVSKSFASVVAVDGVSLSIHDSVTELL